MSPAASSVQYRIDCNDCITTVNHEWIAFAQSNCGEHLLPPAILGQSLWLSISDPTTVQIYRSLLSRVRTGVGPVNFRFRCDAPDTRRLFEMYVTSAAEEAIEFEARLLESHSRAHVSLLDTTVAHLGSLVTICAWCMRMRGVDDAWVDIESALRSTALFEATTVPQLTHGICPSCFDVMLGVLQSA